jgi:hypothetical protein
MGGGSPAGERRQKAAKWREIAVIARDRKNKKPTTEARRHGEQPGFGRPTILIRLMRPRWVMRRNALAKSPRPPRPEKNLTIDQH